MDGSFTNLREAGTAQFVSGLGSWLLTETVDRIQFLGTLLLAYFFEKSDFENTFFYAKD